MSVTNTTSPLYFSNSRGFRISGGATEDNLGESTSGAGDVNSDGYDDIILGAEDADPGGRTQAGEAYVIYGNENLSDIDLSITDTTSPLYFSNLRGFRISGGVAGDELGESVSGTGDVNNDGYDDIVIGAEDADPGGRNSAGEAYVIYGNETLSDIDLSVTNTTSPLYFSNSRGFRILGKEAGDDLGISVGSVGDINNDGYDDVIIGAYDASPGGRDFAGEAYIIYGNATLNDIDLAITNTTSPLYFSHSRGFRVQGGSENNLLGVSVGGGRDVNGDGYSDIIVGGG